MGDRADSYKHSPATSLAFYYASANAVKGEGGKEDWAIALLSHSTKLATATHEQTQSASLGETSAKTGFACPIAPLR